MAVTECRADGTANLFGARSYARLLHEGLFMSNTQIAPATVHHHTRQMRGRDPQEVHRQATPLELLYDLAFVTSFGLAANRYAHALADGHFTIALIGFGISSVAICWAWLHFSWFASAYDTDDWLFRLATMVQMIGVLILATGMPGIFNALEHGARFDNSIMLIGYVVMRFPMVFLWLQARQ